MREEMDRAYDNGGFIPGAADYPPRWAAKAEAFRDQLGPRALLGLPYAAGDRNWLDLFLPEGMPRGLMVFIHGGYWLRFDPRVWSHLAAGALARGWACAMPAYTLAPAARIAQMTQEIGAAIGAAATRVGADAGGPIVVTGHSAGGHLSARMACEDAPLPGPIAARLRRVVPISPLSDLRPLAQSSMNDKLQLQPAETLAESPALLARRAECEAAVWVGGQERPAFLWQARLLSEAWGCAWHVDPGKHHFNVIDGLEDGTSALTGAVLDGL
ncbi:esterase [Defluviimonas sp. 20V17]|uniref:Alpha/beta hydrolase fold n=1 Tax=Allgaiera indica TaxID=765699 RepID=A0AAN4ZXW3_9RHOB|nr:alpha/beta hydrolase [Allgaiera indica]KDB04871.1 esterase [Defluviimonas sp. 20V17]GHD99058.1 esterase [Allgaiera indica]SDW01165.1 alpha/beta hydrolase fold [Allgaiera indica]